MTDLFPHDDESAPQFIERMAREICDSLTLSEIQRLRTRLGIHLFERRGKVANYLRLQLGMPVEKNTPRPRVTRK